MMPKEHRDLWVPVWEVVLIFGIFAVFAGWPIPDSNEAHYITKAIHFWNPDWISGDYFLNSNDTHWTFYVTFGWLSFFLSPYGMAVVGRIVTWGLLAWSWRRLSFALVPLRWMSVPTALALAYYVDAFHMAGEWILGGVEGKSFAFPLVFFGLAAMVRGHWHRTWILLGLASAFHVLVGGWSVLVAGFAWLLTDVRSKAFWDKVKTGGWSGKIPWGLFLGGLLSLPGLLPALLLDRGAPAEIVRQAHQIYVFERISHHLVPYMFPWTYVLRFLLLAGVWAVICRFGNDGSRRHRRFDAFVWGTLLLTLIGFVAAYALWENRTLAAEILRFYWFRLSDIAVPMGVAMGSLWKLLLLLPHHRKLPDVPRLSQWLPLLGIPFGVYLAADLVFFHQRLYSAKIPPEPGIPWAVTLLFAWAALLWLRKNRKDRLSPVFSFWAPLLVFGSLLLYAPFGLFKDLADQRTAKAYSRVEPGRAFTAYYWQDVCRWIVDPVNTPRSALFWVPREGTTFKWHTGRGDVGVWKDVPQDAKGIVRWQQRMHDLFFYRDKDGKLRDDRSFTINLWWKTPEDIETLRQKYGFEYILYRKDPELSHLENLETVYENLLFRLDRVHPMKRDDTEK